MSEYHDLLRLICEQKSIRFGPLMDRFERFVNHGLTEPNMEQAFILFAFFSVQESRQLKRMRALIIDHLTRLKRLHFNIRTNEFIDPTNISDRDLLSYRALNQISLIHATLINTHFVVFSGFRHSALPEYRKLLLGFVKRIDRVSKTRPKGWYHMKPYKQGASLFSSIDHFFRDLRRFLFVLKVRELYETKYKGLINRQPPEVRQLIIQTTQLGNVREQLDKLGIIGSPELIPIIRLFLKDPHRDQDHGYHNMDAAIAALAKFSGKPRYHRLYIDQAFDKDFHRKDKYPARRQLDKTGSETVLIGGKYVGKVIYRLLDKRSLQAWLDAMKARDEWRKEDFDYTPVEPILKKDTRLRIHKVLFGRNKGKYRVATRVLGLSLPNFLSDLRNLTYYDYLNRKKFAIYRTLNKIGINFDDTNDANFVISMHNGKPRLYIIDFDHARPYFQKQRQAS